MKAIAPDTPCTTLRIEVTDTFAGEANYCWVRRYTLAMPKDASRIATMRRVKQAIGWQGIRCAVDDLGDSYTLRPSGMAQICFVNYGE